MSTLKGPAVDTRSARLGVYTLYTLPSICVMVYYCSHQSCLKRAMSNQTNATQRDSLIHNQNPQL